MIASNLIKEMLVTAVTANDLQAATHRLEKLESTQIVDHIAFSDEGSSLTHVLYEHRLTPSQYLPDLAIYSPTESEDDYIRYYLAHDGLTLGNATIYIHLNTRKLVEQVVYATRAAIGSQSFLHDNHAVKGGLPAALFKPRTVKGTASQATPPGRCLAYTHII